MKKIIAAAAVATMFAGAAFADISFSYMGNNYFTGNGGNLKFESAERTDCMSLEISNDTAGAVLDMDLDSSKLGKDQYYAWMNFGLPVGNLQLTAGCFTGRYVNRVKADAGDLDGEDFELFKPGVINGKVGKDSDNLTENKIAMVAAYTLADSLPGTLMIKAGLVKSAWRQHAEGAVAETATSSAEDGWMKSQSGFVGEIAFNMKDLVNANFAVKCLKQNQVSYALFVSPLMVEKLTATAGVTFATSNEYNSTTKNWNSSLSKEIGVDLRVRYQINDQLSVTTMHNLSAGDNNASGSNEMVMWNMLNGSFKAAENITFGLTVQDVINSLDKHSFHNAGCAQVNVSPYIAVKATEKATVTTAFRAELTDVNFKEGNENLQITVPVIVSFSL